MNRRLFLQLSAPATIIGAVLFAAALISMWSIQRLQRNLSTILSDNVTSLEAAQDLEINLRQFRFHSFMHALDPRPDRLDFMMEDHRGFEEALALAKDSASDQREGDLVKLIEEGYARYQKEMQASRLPPKADLQEFVRWADQHPVRHLQQPCRELLQLNKRLMEESADESAEVGRQTQRAVLVLGILGPVSGLVIGYGLSRAWSRSFAHLSVRLHDVHAQLDQELGNLRLDFGKDWGAIDRQVDHIVARVKDAMEQLHRQRQEIRRGEQLAIVGQLAAGVAHEIRNPLTGVKMLVEAALRRRNPRVLEWEDLEVIYREILRLEQSAQDLLGYARLPPPCTAPVDLRQIIQHAWAVVRARAAEQQVDYTVSSAAGAGSACVDAGQFITVFVNLFLNALDAMRQPGRIEITLESSSDNIVQVRVCDPGEGIAADMLPRLFEPFATNKAKGTGLGLSLSRRILEEHGGTLTAANCAGGGACFTLSFPARAREVASEDPAHH